MRVLFFLSLISFFPIQIHAQQFNGTWLGKLNVGVNLRIVFNFNTAADNTVTATMQSPDQSPAILPMDTCYAIGDSIFTSLKRYAVSFKGKLINDSSINGTFTQGQNFELILKKTDKIAEAKRPQTPKPPFDYYSEEVKYFNRDKSIEIAGTLTWPKPEPGVNYFKSPTYPAVILITGSGPQDRDETIFNHKPFAVIADYLTKKGFAVLRYDDRGIGKSTGDFSTATSADFADDVEAGVDFLKKQAQIDTAHIGLIGHSEGGLVAPMVAVRRNDIAHIILMAGPGIPSAALLAEQVEAITRAAGAGEKEVQAGKDFMVMATKEILKTKDSAMAVKNICRKLEKWAVKKDTAFLSRLGIETKEKRLNQAIAQVKQMNSNWFRYFLAFDPQPYLSKLSCNVLAINGAKDVQVLPASNLAGIKAALKKSRSPIYNVIELGGLNHLFQTCKNCTVAEYGELEETIAPKVLEVMTNWLLQYGR